MSEMKPTLLLQVCCAPDATVVLERLQAEYAITVFFYNPNIQPENEYRLRLAELEQLAREYHVPSLSAPYDAEAWFELVRGLEDVPEGGARCDLCFRRRLEVTAQMAQKHGFDMFTTVLTVSPHKNARLINEIGQKIGQQFGVQFMAADFKKRDGFKRSLELSRQFKLYRQNYCGCIFSQRNRPPTHAAPRPPDGAGL